MSEPNTSMRKIPIRNPELLEILNRYVDLRTRDEESFVKYMHMTCKHELENRHYWVGDEYLRKIIDEGEGHEGFPDAMAGYEFRTNNLDHQFFENPHPLTKEESDWRIKFMHDLGVCNADMINFMGCRNQALAAVYPKDGFISWHNNANAYAWNFIFSYSETGEGCFKYWDIEKGEVVVMQDEPGWTCKAGYFGHYGEPDKVFYHSAETDCWRHTVSFCFDANDLSEFYREQIIDEII